jgi:hypothetical protein
MVMIFYGANSELHGVRGAQIPDLLLFGGFSVPNDSERQLVESLHGLKLELGVQRCAIKWNMRDLKREYEQRGASRKYQDVVEVLPAYRERAFQLLEDAGAKAIVTVLESHSVERKIMKLKKNTLSGYAFSILLARVALLADEVGELANTVIVDWPDKGDREPFDSEYRNAYNFGESGGFRYRGGALINRGFKDSVFYTSMTSCELLQLADLVVGVAKDNVQVALNNSKNPVGASYCESLRRILRGYPNRISGYGLIAYSANADFRTCIGEYFSPQSA